MLFRSIIFHRLLHVLTTTPPWTYHALITSLSSSRTLVLDVLSNNHSWFLTDWCECVKVLSRFRHFTFAFFRFHSNNFDDFVLAKCLSFHWWDWRYANFSSSFLLRIPYFPLQNLLYIIIQISGLFGIALNLIVIFVLWRKHLPENITTYRASITITSLQGVIFSIVMALFGGVVGTLTLTDEANWRFRCTCGCLIDFSAYSTDRSHRCHRYSFRFNEFLSDVGTQKPIIMISIRSLVMLLLLSPSSSRSLSGVSCQPHVSCSTSPCSG